MILQNAAESQASLAARKKGDLNMMQLANDALGIGIVVSNIDASLKFYQETLGLEFVQKLPDRHGHNVPAAIR